MLRELGKKFELEKVDLGAKKTDGGKDFYKINGKGYVPTLEIKKGEVLTECRSSFSISLTSQGHEAAAESRHHEPLPGHGKR